MEFFARSRWLPIEGVFFQNKFFWKRLWKYCFRRLPIRGRNFTIKRNKVPFSLPTYWGNLFVIKFFEEGCEKAFFVAYLLGERKIYLSRVLLSFFAGYLIGDNIFLKCNKMILYSATYWGAFNKTLQGGDAYVLTKRRAAGLLMTAKNKF